MNKYTFKPYDPIFPALFLKEKERIASLIAAVAIEHVGSTSVPHLGGKGIIDIAIGADQKNHNAISVELQKLGYEFRPTGDTADRLFFQADLPDAGKGVRRYHVHLMDPKCAEWKNMIAFRDYLRSNPQAAEEYAEIKRQAAAHANQEGKIYQKLKEPIFQKFRSLFKDF
jgi:GrpB-like predicted nucleotidyltransferase (UPF0157 family)